MHVFVYKCSFGNIVRTKIMAIKIEIKVKSFWREFLKCQKCEITFSQPIKSYEKTSDNVQYICILSYFHTAYEYTLCGLHVTIFRQQ